MQIMSLNGWGGKLHDQLIAYLTKIQPSILCLQEVVHTPASPKDWLTYRDTGINLPQRARLYDEICAALPEHTASFFPAAQGDLWDEETRYPSQWGLATFVHSSLATIGQAQGFVHKTFSANGYGDHPRSRNAHVVRIYDFALGLPVTVTHMHGLRDLGGKHDTAERRSQAERLIALVKSVYQPGDGLCVCGDFNVLPDSETINLLKKLELKELVTENGFPGTRTSHYRKDGRFADYMLVNNVLAGADFEVVYTPEVSDHCPLVLSIS